MDHMNKLGVFQQPSYITIGDEYKKPSQVPDRHKHPQFATAPGKKGQGAGLFEKEYKSLHEGDKYVDAGTHEKKYQLEQAKKRPAEVFRYTSPPKKAAGSGNNYGCFNTHRHETEYHVLQKGELPAKRTSPSRNFMTSPPKKGTFGTPGTTIGKGTELTYISNPYDAEHKKVLAEAREAARKITSNGHSPFRSACRRQGCFDESGVTGASKVFGMDRALPEKKQNMASTLPPCPVPFRPSSPGKKGFNCTINKFPEYKEDPIEIRERKRREEAKKAKPDMIWKPISGPKSVPCKTVAMTQMA